MVWITNGKQLQSPPTEEKNKTKGHFWKNVREISVSCSALALFIQSPPNAGSSSGDVSVRAGAHDAQGSGLSLACRLANGNVIVGDPQSVGTCSSHSFLKPQGWENLKAKEKKMKLSLLSPQERQEIGFKLMFGLNFFNVT